MLVTGRRSRLLVPAPHLHVSCGVLAELSVMEQRYQAVLAVVQDGWKVTEVAARLGVSHQCVHAWISRYEQGGLAAVADRSYRPSACPHQISAELEARVCELRREHPRVGTLEELSRARQAGAPSRCPGARALRWLDQPHPWTSRCPGIL
jgi:transposase